MLKIAVFGFYGQDQNPMISPGSERHLSPVTTQDFMRHVWEMEPPETRIGAAPENIRVVKLTRVRGQPVYVQAVYDFLAYGVEQLDCNGYIVIIDAVKVLAPKAIRGALRRLCTRHPAAHLILAAGRQNEPEALSSEEIREILGLNPDLPVLP